METKGIKRETKEKAKGFPPTQTEGNQRETKGSQIKSMGKQSGNQRKSKEKQGDSKEKQVKGHYKLGDLGNQKE